MKRVAVSNNSIMTALNDRFLRSPEAYAMQKQYNINICWSCSKIKSAVALSFRQTFM